MSKSKRRHVPANPRQGSLLEGPRKDAEKEIIAPNVFPRWQNTKKYLPFYGKYNRWAKRNASRLHKAAQKIRAKTAEIAPDVVQEIARGIAKRE